MTEEKTLPDNPTLDELFTYYGIEDGGCRVVPLTIQESDDDTRLLLVVRGEKTTASVIFSEVWARIVEMSQQAEQQKANDDGAGIITP